MSPSTRLRTGSVELMKRDFLTALKSTHTKNKQTDKKEVNQMARLESQARLGVYPTPDHLLPVIASYISPATVPATFLDPCCGEGEALHLMGLMLAGKTYGVELDKERGTQAKMQLTLLFYPMP